MLTNCLLSFVIVCVCVCSRSAYRTKHAKHFSEVLGFVDYKEETFKNNLVSFNF